MESKRMCLKSYIRKLYYEKKISNDEMKCLLEKLEGHDKHLIRNERKSAIDCFTNRLSEYLGVENAAKYGNKYAEQQRNSYSTMMMYEVADLVDDLIEIVKQEAEKYNSGWIPCSERLPNQDGEFTDVLITCESITDGVFVQSAEFYIAADGAPIFDALYHYERVLAWQPLLPPYQPKGE